MKMNINLYYICGLVQLQLHIIFIVYILSIFGPCLRINDFFYLDYLCLIALPRSLFYYFLNQHQSLILIPGALDI